MPYLMHNILKKDAGNLQNVTSNRDQVVVDPRFLDVREGHMSGLKPYQREAWVHFRQSGVFLPFAAYSNHLNTLNHFLFKPDSYEWIIPNMTNPTDGWPMDKVAKFGKQMGLPENDLCGMLFYYV